MSVLRSEAAQSQSIVISLSLSMLLRKQAHSDSWQAAKQSMQYRLQYFITIFQLLAVYSIRCCSTQTLLTWIDTVSGFQTALLWHLCHSRLPAASAAHVLKWWLSCMRLAATAVPWQAAAHDIQIMSEQSGTHTPQHIHTIECNMDVNIANRVIVLTVP